MEDVLRRAGVTWRLLKTLSSPAPETPTPPADVLLVNTTGELMAFYAACDLAYVGKSLAGNAGGHNIIEPAIFGKPIIHGPHMGNFRMVANLFRQAGAAVEVPGDDALEPALSELLASPALRADLGHRARTLVEQSRGAMDRTLDELEARLPLKAEA